MTDPSVILCGLPPEGYDATDTSQEKCPQCGSTNLLWMYGLAAGGMGSYAVCEDCERLSNAKPDPKEP